MAILRPDQRAARALPWTGVALLLLWTPAAAEHSDSLAFAQTVTCVASPAGGPTVRGDQPAESRAVVPTPRREIERPVDRRELQTLLRDLERVPVREATEGPAKGSIKGAEPGRRTARRFLVEESPLGRERFEVALRDVSTALLILQAEDGRELVAGTEGLPPRARNWMDQVYGTIRACALGRYEGWGGEPTFDGILHLVAEYRHELEDLGLGGLPGAGDLDWHARIEPRSAPPRGGGPP